MKVTKKLHENQARVEQLTKDWTEKWKEAQSIMQVGGVGTAGGWSGECRWVGWGVQLGGVGSAGGWGGDGVVIIIFT